ncbi:formate transporter FocA [Trueperella bialowiezensis]|uniref:Formate channel 1 n=1 Tax=Trueperella bialowiezensis TaxID=312285 RepID=A0A3S5EW06_9ACTO|nr:formate transporter FocA [Trueperella bialowiezensis]VEI12966.1 Formate channel 1 [Trueperella bialowiezensis]
MDLTRARSPQETAEYLAEQMLGKATNRWGRMFVLAVAAGVMIGLGFAFYITTQQGAAGAPWIGEAKFLGGVAFSVGLILVVLTGMDLFTSTTMTLVPLTRKQISPGRFAGHWAVVYGGNFLGGLALAACLVGAGTYMQGGGAWGVAAIQTAMAKVSHTWPQAFLLGMFCNVMVCLAVVLAYAGRTVTDKILGIVGPIALFVATGFEHSVANMFLIPAARLITEVAGPQFWESVPALAADLTKADAQSTLTAPAFFFDNLLPVTLGNIVGGGIFVGLFMWFVHVKMADDAVARQ